MAERKPASDELSTQEPTRAHPAEDTPADDGPRPGASAEPVAAQVAAGLAATPGAAEPGPADPEDPQAPADTAIATGAAAADAATGAATSAATPPSAWFHASAEQPTQAMRARPPSAEQPGSLFEPTVPTTGAGLGGSTVVLSTGTNGNGNGNGAHGNGTGNGATNGTAHLPLPGAAAPAAGAENPTEVMAAVVASSPGPAEPPVVPPVVADEPGEPASGGSRRRPLLVAAAVVGLLALLYVVDVVLSLGAVPRGVTVAGVPVGGLEYAAAERELRTQIEPRTTRPVPVTVGQVTSQIDPRTAGLRIDWDATLEQAGSQPLNPVTRISSFFGQREVGVVTDADREALIGALEQLAPVVDREPVEGTVAFEGTRPTPVDPVAGQRLDVPAAAAVLSREWANGLSVALPLTELPSITTVQDVQGAIEKVAAPAVSGPVTILGEKDTEATVEPETIAEALTFTAEQGRGLVPALNPEVVEDAVRTQLASTETPGRDASISFATGAPVIVPSQDGRGIDYPETLKDMLQVITGTGAREITAVYSDQPAELTTEELKSMGITGLISEFTTGGFKPDSGINIKRAAQQINGTIVEPGETFSLNEATMPRTAANGYVEAGVIDDGAPSRGVGGGTSQVATTLYNAAYFAGMVDVEHKEHSFYISRYPAGREATVVAGAIDMRFRNDNPTGVLIQTTWTPASITVRMYGTKRYEVTSTPGPRTNPTQPQTVTMPKGKPCSPSQGGPGFTITDTRTLREVSTGQTRTETRSVRYNPSPIVVCEQ